MNSRRLMCCSQPKRCSLPHRCRNAALCITAILPRSCPLRVIRVRVRPSAAPAMSVMPRKRRSATKMRSVAERLFGYARQEVLKNNLLISLFRSDCGSGIGIFIRTRIDAGIERLVIQIFSTARRDRIANR
jgi:hypothetical protein